MRGQFAGWSQIDASGRLQTFAPDGQAQAAVAHALTEQLRQVAFSPARSTDGTALTVRTYLTGGYSLEPTDDGWTLRITGVRAGPKVTRTVIPRPPQRTFAFGEPAWARVAMTVRADGTPGDIVIEELRGPRQFSRELLDAVRKWRFEPETVEGRSLTVRPRQEFAISLGTASPPIGPACPPAEAGRVLAPGQDSCLPAMASTFVAEKRLGREIRVNNP